VLATGDLPMVFLCQWWRIVVEAEDAFHVMAVAGIEVVGFGNVAEMGVVGYSCFGDAVAGTMALVSALIGEGCRCCTEALRVLPFLC
jgi:hypothetical protein